MNALKKFFLGSAAVLLLLAITGCNTFKGMGRDIQRGGENVEDAAEEVEEEMRD